MENSGRYGSHKRQHCPFLLRFFLVRLPVLELRVLTCAQMLMHVIAHRGWTITNTLSEPVLKTERKNPLPHWGIKPESVLQRLFVPTFYQLSYPSPEMHGCLWNARGCICTFSGKTGMEKSRLDVYLLSTAHKELS